jgi:hypothetical protein
MTWSRLLASALRILVPLLLLTLLYVLLWPRAAIITIDARTQVMTFSAGDDSSLAYIQAGTLRTELGGPEEPLAGVLEINKGTRVRAVRTGRGPLALALSRDDPADAASGSSRSSNGAAPGPSVGRVDGRPLGSKAWLNIDAAGESNFLLTFTGDFSVGSLVGRDTQAVLLEGSTEIVERVAFSSETYVNDRLALLPGDYAESRDPRSPTAAEGDDGSEAKLPPSAGFIYLSQGLQEAGGIHVHAEAPPDFVQLTRSPRRPGVRLKPTYWGRIRESSEFAAIVVLLGCLGAIAESAGFFLKRNGHARPELPLYSGAPQPPEIIPAPTAPLSRIQSNRASSLGIAAAFVALMVAFAWTRGTGSGDRDRKER